MLLIKAKATNFNLDGFVDDDEKVHFFTGLPTWDVLKTVFLICATTPLLLVFFEPI